MREHQGIDSTLACFSHVILPASEYRAIIKLDLMLSDVYSAWIDGKCAAV